MKRIFLIDTENTNNYSFIENKKLNSDDEVIFFCTKNSISMKFEYFSKLVEKGINIRIENLIVKGKNSLDHHLVIFLTLEVIKNKNYKYFVISNDKGFLSSIAYLKKLTKCSVEVLPPSESISKKNKNSNNITIEIGKYILPTRLEYLKYLLKFNNIKNSEKIAVKIDNMLEKNLKRGIMLETLENQFSENGVNAYKCVKDAIFR